MRRCWWSAPPTGREGLSSGRRSTLSSSSGDGGRAVDRNCLAAPTPHRDHAARLPHRGRLGPGRERFGGDHPAPTCWPPCTLPPRSPAITDTANAAWKGDQTGRDPHAPHGNPAAAQASNWGAASLSARPGWLSEHCSAAQTPRQGPSAGKTWPLLCAPLAPRSPAPRSHPRSASSAAARLRCAPRRWRRRAPLVALCSTSPPASPPRL